jgi:hypothetical protein
MTDSALDVLIGHDLRRRAPHDVDQYTERRAEIHRVEQEEKQNKLDNLRRHLEDSADQTVAAIYDYIVRHVEKELGLVPISFQSLVSDTSVCKIAA